MNYNEKLRLAKEALASGSYDKKTIEYLFPELKEGEDDRIRKALLNEFIHLQSKGYKFAGLEGEEIVTWLEKQGKQKPTWSEEDEEILKSAISLAYDVGDINMYNWLQSLKEKYTWKPSDEQMEALLKLEEMHVLEHEKNQENAHLYMVIKSLREQLLKLKKGE